MLRMACIYLPPAKTYRTAKKDVVAIMSVRIAVKMADQSLKLTERVPKIFD